MKRMKRIRRIMKAETRPAGVCFHSSIRIPQFQIRNRVMPHRERKNIQAGLKVAIVPKQDQRTGKQTIGVVKDLLTNSAFHSHGIKVRLTDGQVGRVQEIL